MLAWTMVKLDAIARAIRDLPASKQWELREKLEWLSDPGDVIVEIHDWKGSDRKRPRARAPLDRLVGLAEAEYGEV